MLHASCHRTSNTLTQRVHEISARAVPKLLPIERNPACKSTPKAPLARRLRANGLFDDIFKRNKPHAPELVRLDTEDEGGLGQTSSELFGPLAVLLVGFSEHEVQKFRSIMLDMDADMVKIIICDKQMFHGTVAKAFAAPGHMHTQQVGERAVILSGMNAAEVGEIIGAYRDSELPEPVWAAALAANWDRKVKDLVNDIYGDHRYMMDRERNAGLSG